MPSRNSINRPKDTMHQAHKSASLARKRLDRSRKGLTAPPRSSSNSTSGKAKSTAVALYNGSLPTGVVTTKTLSKKRAKKIERNKKYIANRKQLEQKLLIDATAQTEEQMDIDENPATKKEKRSKIDSVKDALWSVIEDSTGSAFVVDSTGEGTTLGGPSFF